MMAKVNIDTDLLIKRFAFLLGQEIAKSAPKDTGKMSQSFRVPTEIRGTTIIFNPVDYWQFVEYGTYKMRAQPFVRPTIHSKADELLQKAIDGVNK